MLTPTHILTGSALAKFALSTSLFPHSEGFMYAVGILASNIVDVDVIRYGIRPQHRTYSILHKPCVWVCLFLLSTLLMSLKVLPIPFPTLMFAFTCIVIHFLLDTFGVSYGIEWLWPWKHHDVHFFPTKPPQKTVPKRIGAYIHHPAFIVEILLLVASTMYLVLV